MKALLLFFSWLAAINLFGQCPYYQKYMDQGNTELKKGSKADFQAAINAYSTAMLHCPEKAELARKKIVEVFLAIERLKNDAERDKLKAQKALIEKEEAKKMVDEALKKAKKLIDAIYFYDGKFALVFKDDFYYFIDKNGDWVYKLGYWIEAEQFDETGFAIVRYGSIDTVMVTDPRTYEQRGYASKNAQEYYLLDTTGNTYLLRSLYYTTSEAIDFRSDSLDTLPLGNQILDTIKIALLSNNKLKLSSEVLGMKKLEFLDMSSNHLDSIPLEIGNLERLSTLNLSKNSLKHLPAELGKLISVCP